MQWSEESRSHVDGWVKKKFPRIQLKSCLLYRRLVYGHGDLEISSRSTEDLLFFADVEGKTTSTENRKSAFYIKLEKKTDS